MVLADTLHLAFGPRVQSLQAACAQHTTCRGPPRYHSSMCGMRTALPLYLSTTYTPSWALTFHTAALAPAATCHAAQGRTCSTGDTCVASRSSLSTGAKAGIAVGSVVGGLAFIGILFGGVYLCRKRSAANKAVLYGHHEQEMQPQQQLQPQVQVQQLPYEVVAGSPVLKPQ